MTVTVDTNTVGLAGHLVRHFHTRVFQKNIS